MLDHQTVLLSNMNTYDKHHTSIYLIVFPYIVYDIICYFYTQKSPTMP